MVRPAGFGDLPLARHPRDIELDDYIHVVFDLDYPNHVNRLTTDDDEVVEALRRGLPVANHQPLAVLLLVLKGRMPWELMSDRTWRTVVAPALQVVGERHQAEKDEKALWDGIPVDLPAPFADKRLKLLIDEYRPEDLLAIVELTEIVMSLQAGRAPDEALFRERSLSMSWKRGMGAEEDGVHLSIQYNLELQEKYHAIEGGSVSQEQRQFALRMCNRLEVEQRELVIALSRDSA